MLVISERILIQGIRDFSALFQLVSQKCDPDFTQNENHPYLGHTREPKTSLASRVRRSLHPKRTLVEDEGEDNDSEQEAGEQLQVNSGASKKRKKLLSPY